MTKSRQLNRFEGWHWAMATYRLYWDAPYPIYRQALRAIERLTMEDLW